MRDAHPGPGMNMKKDKSTVATRQRLRYIIADYVAVNVAVLLFNIFRFFFIGRHDTPEGLEYYPDVGDTCARTDILSDRHADNLRNIGILQQYTPEKSRLSELNQTVSGAVIGSLGIYLLALINDPMSMRRHIYLLILILALLLFGCTYAARYAPDFAYNLHAQETETNLLHADNRKLAKIAQDIQYNQEKRLGMGS